MLEDFANDLDLILQAILDFTDLSEREREVIDERWMHDGKPTWLEEVAKTRGVTRERIRQVEAKGFRKIREHKDRLQPMFEKRDELIAALTKIEARLRLLDSIRWRKLPEEERAIEEAFKDFKANAFFDVYK